MADAFKRLLTRLPLKARPGYAGDGIGEAAAAAGNAIYICVLDYIPTHRLACFGVVYE